MARARTQMEYFRQQTDSEISNLPPDLYDDGESGILDSAILDDNDIMSSPDAHLRRGSLASNGLRSPAEPQGWERHYSGSLSNQNTAVPVHYPHQDEHNSFIRPIPPHGQTFIGQPHPQQWAYDHGSSHGTPTTAGSFMPAHEVSSFYEIGPSPTYPHHAVDSARGSFSHHGSLPQHFAPAPPAIIGAPEPQFVPSSQVQTPMSPHSHQDWKAMAQSELEARPGARRMRPSIASPRTHVDEQRSSGVRKKNARIEIPSERNIQTIDRQLENEQDEDTIRELKQQKRLLRNREAALASRQRKKKHTEELEGREKDYTLHLHSLEGLNSNLKISLQNNALHVQKLEHEIQELQRQNNMLQDREREMIHNHAEETSVLRKRIQILTEHQEAGPAPAMSATASSTGYNDFNAHMGALNVNGFNEYSELFNLDEFSTNPQGDFLFDLKPEPAIDSPVLPNHIPGDAVPNDPKRVPDSSNEQPVASGLLFFLLLCGAFVASKPAVSRTAEMMEVPDDVRAAAPTVLANLLQEAVPSSTPMSATVTRHAPSGPSGSTRPRTSRGKQSRLDRIHQRITSPTKQQEADAVFSLSTAQYASISDADCTFIDEHGPSSQQPMAQLPRPSLAEALAKAREEYIQSSTAEVYTRSLLWDKIPAETVQQFRKMMKPLHDIDAHQRQMHDAHDGNDDGLMTFNMKAER